MSGLTKAQAHKKYHAAKEAIRSTYDLATFQKFFPTAQSLVEFWHDIKYLSFPEFYAQSPYDTIADIAYILVDEKITPSTIRYMLSELNADYEWRREDMLKKLQILNYYNSSVIPSDLASYLTQPA